MKQRARVDRCPNSDSVLHQAVLPKGEKLGVELEQCHDCGGIFVNDFVLKNRMDRDLEFLHAVDLALLQTLKGVRRVSDLPCPQCSERMEKISLLNLPDNFIVAYCRICDALWYNLVFISGSDPARIEGKSVSEVFSENERAEILKVITEELDALIITPTMNPYDASPRKDIEQVADELPRSHATNIVAISELIIERILSLPEPAGEHKAKKVRQPDGTHLKQLVEAGERELGGQGPVNILIAPMLTAMRARDLLDDEGIKSFLDYEKEERKYSKHPRFSLSVSAKDEPHSRVILSEAFRTERITDSLK